MTYVLLVIIMAQFIYFQTCITRIKERLDQHKKMFNDVWGKMYEKK